MEVFGAEGQRLVGGQSSQQAWGEAQIQAHQLPHVGEGGILHQAGFDQADGGGAVGNRRPGPQADPPVGAESGGDIHGQEVMGPLLLARQQ